MKKLICLVLAIVMVFSLAACGNSGSSAPASSQPAASGGANTSDTPAAPAPAAEPADDFSWPEKELTFVVTHNPGGDTDFNARLIAKYLEKELGVTIVVENLSGGNGSVCVQQYAVTPADNYTFVLTNTAALGANYVTGLSTANYEDFDPVAIYGRGSGECIIVRPDFPYDTIEEAVEASKEHPGEIVFGGPVGGASYLANYLVLTEIYDAEFGLLEYGDSAERIPGLLGNHIDITTVSLLQCSDYIKSGQVKALCTVASKAAALYPDMPVCSDTYPKVINDLNYVCLALKGTDPQVVERLNAAIMNIIENNAEYKEECETMNYQEPWALNVTDTYDFLAEQQAYYIELADLAA